MATVSLDTLALARKLEAVGFSEAGAGHCGGAGGDIGEDMLTRRHRSEAATSVRTETRELEGRLGVEIKEAEHRMTVRLGAMMAASIALVTASVRPL